MYAEDEYIQALVRRDKEIDFHIKEKEKKDQVINEKDQVISEKDQAISEKDQVINEKDQAISEKDKKLIDLAKFLKESNFPIGIIVEKTGLNKEDIEDL